MTDAKHVLIVDDEADIRDGVSRWLRSVGYETSMAQDGVAGVESAVTDTPDAILLDVLMPGMDGMETLAELKATHSTESIPVVMLSASLRDEQRALDAGARYFVHKPYEGKKIIRAVKAAIDQTNP